MPKLVRENNGTYFLGGIPTGFFFWNKKDALSGLKGNAVLLANDDDFCLVANNSMMSDNNQSTLKKHSIENCEFYFGDEYGTMLPIYLKKEFKNVLLSICNN